MTQLEIDVPGADVPGTAPETDGLDGLGDPGSGTPGTGHHPESQGADREHLGQMRLSRLQLHNWGTFEGGHDLPVPRGGLLLTGESGSGKSSVLDAITAVLIRPGEARFNAAAQDGPVGDRDRSPMSYVRGAYRKHADAETGEVRPGYLRPGPTVSGIALTFEDAAGKVVTALRVLHVAGRSAASADLRTAFLLFDRAVELSEVLELSRSGIDRRRLKRGLSPLVASETYTKFGVQLRRATGIGSEAAQRLLHRTQSAKSLTSLDNLLRDFMLDRPETFDLAEQAVEHFRALQDAHATVVDAREQVEVLRPQRELWTTHRSACAQRDRLVELHESVDAFRFTLLAELAEQDLTAARSQVEVALHERERALRGQADARRAESEARQALDARGGAALELLDRDLEDARARTERIAQQIARLLPVLERLGSPIPESAADLAAAHGLVHREQERIEQEIARLTEAAGPEHVARGEALRRISEAEQEIISLRDRRSNLPFRLVEVRDQLARAAGVAPSALPFAGELMNVRDPSWQGAIERLLHGLASTILVPDRLYPVVAETVEGRHWGTRISYERVRGAEQHDHAEHDGRAGEGTVLSVLELAESPFRAWLRRRIARSHPHVLVDEVAELARHERALTRAGQIKNRDQHVKDDRFRIDDRSRWIIGTDNTAKLEAERAQLAEAERELERRDRALAQLEKQRRAEEGRSVDLARLLEVSWDDLDQTDAAQRLEALSERRAALLADTDLAQLEETLRRTVQENGRAQEHYEQARDAHRDLEQAASSAEEDLTRAREGLQGAALDPGHRAELESRTQRVRRVTRQNLPEAMISVSTGIRDDLDAARDTIRSSESALATARSSYLTRWAERSANLVDDIAATPDFLAILARLEADRLPEFEHRFRDLLRTQSQNNIGQLRAVISQAIRDVHQRLAPVNESLRATPFDTERRTWLTLVAQQKHTEEVKTLLKELLDITHGAFHQQEETIEEAEARYARMDALLRRLGSAETTDRSWQRRVLDTRLHVEFEARELDESGTPIDVYRGSDGRSGGQRQRLVTFCLAAALRYQLTDAAAGTPPYGLVVLDEAFDKTDIHFTRAGLEVFRSFGFQLLLATPLKMLQTIEQYVGGAAVVANPTGNESRLSAVMFTEPDDEDEGDQDAPEAAADPADGASQ